MELPQDPRILIVDDDLQAHQMIWGGLRLAGVLTESMTKAYDGYQALTLIQQGQQFDLIISDMDMPDVNGLAFFQRLRQRGDKTPFIMSTGGNAERQLEIEDVFAKNGGNAVFTEKPFTKDKFQEALGKLQPKSDGPKGLILD